MLERFTYQQRNIGLAVVFALSLYLVYALAVGKTVDMAEQCSELEQQQVELKDSPVRMANLLSEQKAIDVVLGNSSKYEDFQQALLDKVSVYCQSNSLVLREFPKPWSRMENNYLVETNLVVVQGPFEKLVKLVYELEQQERLGKVAGVQFKTEERRRAGGNKRLELTVAIYLQNVKKALDEA